MIFLKNKALEGGGAVAGTFGSIGSIPNLCHALCLSVISFISLFGITISILPLMFFQTYRLYFWLTAFLLAGISFYLFFKKKNYTASHRNFLLINTGLIIFSMPFSFVADYMDFFRFVGVILVFIGLFLFFFEKRFKFSDYFTGETSPDTSFAPLLLPIAFKFNLPKFNLSSVLFAFIVSGFLVNQYMMYRTGVFSKATPLSFPAMRSLSSMKLTAFDVALAKERMDKNNDGICDVCGMPIQQCIDSGQIDCNMGNNPSAIGVLGSEHTHADMKVYVNGQALDFAKPEYYMRSSFLHFDTNQNKEDAGSVLHQHAKKVPLWLLFRSLGMSISPDSITTADGRIWRNESDKTLKFYLNGKKVDELVNYSYQPNDKLLISYGPTNDPNIQKELDSVIPFAKNH